jgi:hypothetical protein
MSDTKGAINRWTPSVIRVDDGRGFVVNDDRNRVIITTAHCLPNLPPIHGAAFPDELIFADILGPLGEEPTVACAVFFADPVAEIAVLGTLDDQELREQVELQNSIMRRSMPSSRSRLSDWSLSANGTNCRAGIPSSVALKPLHMRVFLDWMGTGWAVVYPSVARSGSPMLPNRWRLG